MDDTFDISEAQQIDIKLKSDPDHKFFPDTINQLANLLSAPFGYVREIKNDKKTILDGEIKSEEKKFDDNED